MRLSSNFEKTMTVWNLLNYLWSNQSLLYLLQQNNATEPGVPSCWHLVYKIFYKGSVINCNGPVSLLYTKQLLDQGPLFWLIQEEIDYNW